VRHAVAGEAGDAILPEHVEVNLTRAEAAARLLAAAFLAAGPSSGRRLGNGTGIDMGIDVWPPAGAHGAVLASLGSGDAAARAVASRASGTPGMAPLVPGDPPRVTRRPERRAALQSRPCPSGARVSSFGHFAVLSYSGAGADLAKLTSSSYATMTEGVNAIRERLHCFYDMADFDGEMVFPYQQLPAFSNYNLGLGGGGNTNYDGELDDVDRPFIVFNTFPEDSFRRGASGPFLHEVMHTWGVGLAGLLDHPDHMPHGHWGITADDSHGYLGGFPREAFKCATHSYSHWSEDTWTGSADTCPGKRVKIDCEQGRTHYGQSELHRDQAARAAGGEPSEEDLSVPKYSDFELLLMGARRPEDIQGDLIHCKGQGHLCEREHYLRDYLRCESDSLEQGAPFGLLFASAVDVRDIILGDGGAYTRLTLAGGGVVSGWRALELRSSVPTASRKSWLLYALSGGSLYAMELEVRVASGNEAQGAGAARQACIVPTGSPRASCAAYTCDGGWVDRPGKASVTCSGRWCEVEECCQPPASQPVVVEMRSLKVAGGFAGTAEDVQRQFAGMADAPQGARFRGLRYHQVVETDCADGVVVKSAQQVYDNYIDQEVKNMQFTSARGEFRFLAVVVRDPADPCRAPEDGLGEFGGYLARSAARFQNATRHASADREARLAISVDGKCKAGADCDAAPQTCDAPAASTTTITTITGTSTTPAPTTTTTTTAAATTTSTTPAPTTTTTAATGTTPVPTTTTTTPAPCPATASPQGQSCTANSGDAAWKWMADNAFGLGDQYHGTVRPDMPNDVAPHGLCLTFGCVADWRYQGSGSRATLQCRDGTWAVVSPSTFQQDDAHRCAPP